MPAQGFYFDPDGTDLTVFLGATEARIMEIAWAEGEVTVKQVLSLWPDSLPPAYNTIMTILVRLTEKGLLERTKRHRYFVYSPTSNRSSFLNGQIARVKTCLERSFGTSFR